MKKVVITHAKRTPIGSFGGTLASFTAAQLGSFAIKAVLEESGIDKSQVDEVIFGNVLMAGQGQAPARQAAIYAGLPDTVETMTLNKMCGSGLKAIMLAQQAILAGDADVIIAGGMESMSNAPYLLPKARNGFKYGHGEILDSVLLDGLTDVYNKIHMGNCAEICAKNMTITREELDEFAINSYTKAQNAQKEGRFNEEMIPLVLKTKAGETVIDKDEDPEKTNFAKIPTLRPVFDKEGVVTAANASNLNDGAAAVLVMSEEKALELGFKPLVEIVAQSSAAKAPVDFTIAPADAIHKVLNKAGLTVSDIDLYEINEAFAVVSIAVNRLTGITTENTNVNGGAIALGHPIGASGARIVATLVHEMMKRNSTYGLASLCIGGGEASAMIVKKYE
ncbi:MAG: acetyl-CoA C-acetyltransferase [Ignavibacteria bacterium]|nr:acetyl-CoA C-acetyltransferase [Ignavibacteria bacterium]